MYKTHDTVAESLDFLQVKLMMTVYHGSINLIHEAKAKMQLYTTVKHITMLGQFVAIGRNHLFIINYYL